jgi:hypothetical protein
MALKVAISDRVKFSGDSGYSGDSKINIKFFGIGYTNIMCSARGSIHPQVIKPSFRENYV